MKSQKQVGINASYMRGGTSKGIFIATQDLPDWAQKDAQLRDALLLRIAGSPDPYAKQIDGMGGATSSTSKVVLVNPSSRPDCDVDYWFGAVSIDKAVVDWSGNCGNLTSAVGPFAIARGFVKAPAEGAATVRIWQANIGKKIIAQVPMAGGEVQELGDFELDGVTFPAAEIKLEFIDPGAEENSAGGAMFPTGHMVDRIEIPGVGTIEATLINAGNPTIFVNASAVGLKGNELQDEVNSDLDFLTRCEAIRARCAVEMGLAATADEATEKRPHTPKLAFVSKPLDYIASSGKSVSASDIDMLARIMSMGKLHHAMTGTGAVAIAVAASIPGTLVSNIFPAGPLPVVRFGHPSGTLSAGATAEIIQGTWTVTKATMSRSARRLMDGKVFVPSP